MDNSSILIPMLWVLLVVGIVMCNTMVVFRVTTRHKVKILLFTVVTLLVLFLGSYFYGTTGFILSLLIYLVFVSASYLFLRRGD